MDKALVGNFKRELEAVDIIIVEHTYYHSESAALQMLTGTEGCILWDNSDCSYSDLKSDLA